MSKFDHESQMERHMGSEPLIPTRGISLSMLARLQQDETSYSRSEPSMLQRLPDEILLMIVSYISGPRDEASVFAFFVLGQVSRRFRRLLLAEDFINHPFSRRRCCQMCADGLKDKHTSQVEPSALHCFQYTSTRGVVIIGGDIELKTEGRRRPGPLGVFIRSSITCKNCQESREARLKVGYSATCKFSTRNSEELLHCHSCEMDHPPLCFSKDQAKLLSGRVCIASEGYIRICEHKKLNRADIKLLLPNEMPEDTLVFVTSCNHPDHKVPCSDNSEYTDQTPSVFATNPGGSGVMLHILWRGHSGSDRSTLHPSGYLHRHKLNDSLRKIRQKGGHLYLPQRGPNTLPEWNAISEFDRSEALPSEVDLVRLRGGWGFLNRHRQHNLALLGPERIACGHCKYDKSCIVVHYHRKIRFSSRGLSCAPHDWFHAIDRESYVYNGPAGVPETCNIDTCRNSYVGKEDQFDQWPQKVNWYCEKDGDRFCDSTGILVAQEKKHCGDDSGGIGTEELQETLPQRDQATHAFEPGATGELRTPAGAYITNPPHEGVARRKIQKKLPSQEKNRPTLVSRLWRRLSCNIGRVGRLRS
ncbi:hypothetical protein FPANT_12675 [Fusarium pseudoanthophilum]|uniref:F-box domain-containing protein n=1 Tax=Fusarium pseudoanthophilum TaxID=48495 RepID=A0A8H5KGS7_9HYPO|nr:hypothetical protein FPANT_12675 [Fusarium pseudoanthophilum]